MVRQTRSESDAGDILPHEGPSSERVDNMQRSSGAETTALEPALSACAFGVKPCKTCAYGIGDKGLGVT